MDNKKWVTSSGLSVFILQEKCLKEGTKPPSNLMLTGVFKRWRSHGTWKNKGAEKALRGTKCAEYPGAASLVKVHPWLSCDMEQRRAAAGQQCGEEDGPWKQALCQGCTCQGHERRSQQYSANNDVLRASLRSSHGGWWERSCFRNIVVKENISDRAWIAGSTEKRLCT